MRRQGPAARPDRPGAAVPVDAGVRSIRGPLTPLVIGAVVVVGVLDDPTYQRLGPWLASLTPGQRAALGAVVGAVAAAPRALRLLPAVWQRVRWPVDAVVTVAGLWVCVVWMTPRGGGSGLTWAAYRDDAGWFIPASMATFLAVLLAVELAVHRMRARDERLTHAARQARDRAAVATRRRGR